MTNDEVQDIYRSLHITRI